MPLTVANSALVEVTFVSDSGAFIGEVTHGLTGVPSGEVDSLDVEDLADAYDVAYNSNHVDEAQWDGARLGELIYHNLDTPSQAPITASLTTDATEGSDGLPFQVAALVSLATGLSGRSGRGRNYWPLYTEASSVENTFNSTSALNLALFYLDLQDAIFDVFGGSLAVVSRKNSSAAAVTDITVHGTFRTQRRRNERII